MHDLFAEADSDAEVMSAPVSSGSATSGHSGLAYIEMLRYAPCIVPFEDRAMVFQELIALDKMVRPRLCQGMLYVSRMRLVDGSCVHAYAGVGLHDEACVQRLHPCRGPQHAFMSS